MSGSRESSRRGAEAVGLAVVGVLAAVIVYVLSVGPAARLCRHAESSWCASGSAAQRSLETFYAPVVWLHEDTPLRAPLSWYVEELWGVE
jgi:hypothetical protein